MTFSQKISAYTLGFLTDKDLPGLALTGLEEGFNSESLLILAGHDTKDNPFLLNDYFIKALKELGVTEKGRRQALISVATFYAKNIVERKVDTYAGFTKLNEIVNKTEFEFDDIDLQQCYVEYISIWEEKMGGLDFHTAKGLTKQQYIEKAEERMRKYLQDWLNVDWGT